MNTVLIFGAAGDPQVTRVESVLRARKARALLFDTGAFPAHAHASVGGGAIFVGGRRLPSGILSVYLRGIGASPLLPEYAADLKSRPRGLIAQIDECFGLVAAIVLSLKDRGVRIVNDLEVNAQHSRKPYQLHLLRSAGLPVPRFLATNDPRQVRDFVRRVGRAVYKPLAGGATVREVLRADLGRDRLSALELAPVLFQERVEGVSVRAYVVGSRVVSAAEIHSSELDYRRNEGAVVPVRLSAEERRACLRAAHVCGMRFAGVDLIRGRRRFHVLECNPSPMFAVYEQKTGADIAGPLCDLLLKPNRHL
jgi:glutathione synthase/RimK-type ligase-like ATP-grasp enzyme